MIENFKSFEKKWYGLGELEDEGDYKPKTEPVIVETITIDDDGLVPAHNGLLKGLKFKSPSNLTFDIWGGTTISITIGVFRDWQINFARETIENWKGTREELDILVNKAIYRFNHSHTYTYHRNARELVEVNVEILHPKKLNEIFNKLADNFVEYRKNIKNFINEKYDPNSDYDFEIDAYRKLTSFCLNHGFKYSHYERKGDYLTVSNDTIPGSKISTPYKNVADRFERWFKWMKNNTKK